MDSTKSSASPAQPTTRHIRVDAHFLELLEDDFGIDLYSLNKAFMGVPPPRSKPSLFASGPSAPPKATRKRPVTLLGHGRRSTARACITRSSWRLPRSSEARTRGGPGHDHGKGEGAGVLEKVLDDLQEAERALMQ